MLEEKDGYKMRMIVPKPTDPEKLKKREELSNRLKEYPNEELKAALEWIQAKEEQEEREKREQEEREKVEEEEGKTGEVPEEIKDFRKKWEWRIDLDEEKKNKIIEATNRIAPKIKIEPDWSRRIEMKIWRKEYKILDVNIETHTDDKYGISYSYSWTNKDEVMLWWMRWDNVDNWKNQKLKEYVKEKQREKFHIPKIEEVNSILNELWEEVGIIKERDKIAMLIYLTGMYGDYWLSMWDDKRSDSQANSRSILWCKNNIFDLTCFNGDDQFASLFMIACD